MWADLLISQRNYQIIVDADFVELCVYMCLWRSYREKPIRILDSVWSKYQWNEVELFNVVKNEKYQNAFYTLNTY